MRRLLLILAVLAVPLFAGAAAFQPYAKLDARAANEGLRDQESSWLALGSLTLIPAWKATDKLIFLPLMNIRSEGKNKALPEDDPYVSEVAFLGKPTLRYGLAAFDLKAWGSAKRAVTKEFQSQAWSAGRYDSEEFGGGVGGSLKEPLAGWLGPLSLSAEWHHRSYQNFHGLAAQITKDKNYYIKDYDGCKLDLEIEAGPTVLFLNSLGYTVLFKNFTDANLVKRDLTYDLNGLRWDQLHKVKVSITIWSGSSFSWQAVLGEDFNLSNQNHFDAKTNLFIPDYYGYNASVADLTFAWLAGGKKDASSASLAYRVENRNYTGRPLRNPNGSYTEGKQTDIDHKVSLDGRYPVISHAAIVGGASYRSVISNTGYIPGLRPTFDLYLVNLGLEFKL